MTIRSLNQPARNNFMCSQRTPPSFISCQAKNGPFTVRPPECTITSQKLLRSPEILTKPRSVRGKGPPPPSTFIPRLSNCCGDNYSRMRSTCCASTASFFGGRGGGINARLANLCGERWRRQESEAEEDAGRERDKIPPTPTPPPRALFAKGEKRGVIITLWGFWILQLLSSVC